MTNQTDLISEVRASLQAATPGPWTTWERSDGIQVVEKDGELSICDMDGGTWAEWMDNAHLISNSPTWLQQLTDRLEEAVKALEWYGDEENHKQKKCSFPEVKGVCFELPDILDDRGELARTTLKRIKGEIQHESENC